MTKTVTLGETATFINGYPFKPTDWKKEGLPIIRIQDLTGNAYETNYFAGTVPAKYYVHNGDILISWSASLGIYEWQRGDAVLNQHIFKVVFDKLKVDKQYFRHIVGYKLNVMAALTHGATMKHITKGDFDNMSVPLPPLPEQRRIAALLDRADALRQKDRQLLAHYDKLAQSIFLDLFGDPVKNEKGWERVKIRDLVREVKYGTSKPAEDKGAFPYLRMNNITYEGHWNFTDLKYINLTKAEEPKYLLQKGDLVFNRTNSKELVGKTAVYQRDDQMAIAGYLIRSRVNEKATPEYISAYLNSKHGKATLKGMCKNIIGMANINAQELQEIDILQPPLSLQTHFAQLMEQIERQKAVVRQQMAASEGLFGRLLQESFT